MGLTESRPEPIDLRRAVLRALKRRWAGEMAAAGGSAGLRPTWCR